MSEQPTPPPGLSPRFDLGQSLQQANLESTEWPFHHAVTAAQRVTGVLEQAQEVIEQSKIDKKTGLLNEETWRDNLVHTIEELKPGDSVTVRVFDLNGFREANTKFGHHGGDELLGIVGQALLNTHIRSSDQIAHGARDNISRLGGDEFALSFVTKAEAKPATDKEQRAEDPSDSDKLEAERINAELQRLLQGTIYAGIDLSIAAGSSQYEQTDNPQYSPKEIADISFSEADVNMFQMKWAGKIDLVTAMSPEDKKRAKENIVILDRVHHRVEDWFRNALADAA
jgi:diguanylate cyclase (GGDEF)-like protein